MVALAFLCAPIPALAQEPAEASSDEVVANLAAGRVIILVVKQAILIATAENPIEAETHPPIPVSLPPGRRAGIMLGAVDWFSVTTQQTLVRLDRDLPQFHARMIPQDPRLKQPQEGTEATDIQAIGMGVFERLHDVAASLHNKMNFAPDEPIAELILADYIEGYGPEVWQALYPIQQDLERGDYWNTRVLHPRYFQFWPPEKGEPRTLVELSYPPDDKTPALLELLRQGDPRLQKIRESDPKLSQVADLILHGQSTKAPAADAIQFLRAALAATTPPNSRQTLAAVGELTGFEWILPPPPERARPTKKPPRPEGAPTLAKPPSDP